VPRVYIHTLREYISLQFFFVSVLAIPFPRLFLVFLFISGSYSVPQLVCLLIFHFYTAEYYIFAAPCFCMGRYCRIVNKQVTTFTFRAQATTCSKHHTRTVMDAGCECAP